MRRPLFWVCLFLSILAVLHLFLGEAVRRQAILWEELAEDAGTYRMRAWGRVCRKEEKASASYFWMELQKDPQTDSLNILLSDSDFSGENAHGAAVSQQIISCMQRMKTKKIRCQLERAEDLDQVKLGSTVLAEGDFSFYSESSNPGEFNGAFYYQGLGVGGAIYGAKVVSAEGENWLWEGLYRLGKHLGDQLSKIMPEREAGVLRAMLLGDRGDLDPELKALYQKGGILHVLSISGLHVTLLGMGIYRMLRRMGLPRGACATAGGALLVLYGIMTGMSVSACRAIGMFLLRMLAELWGRTYDLTTALAVLAAALLCADPLYAMQSGFWLSFGALSGVGVILPVLERQGEGKMGNLRPGEGRISRILRQLLDGMTGSLRAGLAVSLATLPMLLCTYYEVPVYSMLLNLLVIPAMGILVLFGFVAMLVPGMAFLGWVDFILLRLFEASCRAVTALPFSTWNPGCPEPWQLAAYYVLLTILLFFLWRREGRGRFGALVLLPILIFGIPVHGGAGVTFLDVGQGDAIFLRSEKGKIWLCDCGSTSRQGVGEQVLLPFLKHEGVHEIEGIFLTHGDADHVNGILELLTQAKEEGMILRRLLLPNLGEERLQEDFGEVLEAAKTLPDLEICLVEAGDVIRGRDISFLAFHPREEGAVSLDANQSSLCLYAILEAKGEELSLLLAGDVEGRGEELALEELKRQGITRVDVLKCAHHGSKYATSPEFLEWLDGEVTVISCGRKNRYGHPAAETLDRLEADGFTVFRTDLGGAIRLKWDGKKMRIRPYWNAEICKNAE